TTQPSGGSNSMSGGTDSPTTTGPDPTTSTTAPTTMSTTTTTDTTGWDPTATTGPPATCEGPEDCTGEGSGDPSTFVLPSFRGEGCTADQLRPGDMLPVSWSPCVHPCVDPNKTGWRYLVRCVGGMGCEIAFLQYYRETTGSNCPADVFAKFNEDGCKYLGPHGGLSEALASFGYPQDRLLIPFLTNDDATAISMLEPAADVWKRIDGHDQADDRYIPLSVSEDNPAAPTECGPGVPGCTCKQIGF